LWNHLQNSPDQLKHMAAYQVDPASVQHEIGLAWAVKIPSDLGMGDTNEAQSRSSLVVFEDDKPLGPAHAPHIDIREVGGGRYSHWHDFLYFSTTDGSDPRINGRHYRAFANLSAASSALGVDASELIDRAERQRYSRQGLIRLKDHNDYPLQVILFLNNHHIYVNSTARILDFGCGAGEFVFKMRDMGFNCVGFDLNDYVRYRNDDDKQHFSFSPESNDDTSNTIINATSYTIPFPDSSFDIIHSSSVIEHVMDIDVVLKECARVLKPRGVCIHFYPGKLRLVEPHVEVPLASFFHPDPWLYFWARLGVRNDFQSHLTNDQVVESNKRYFSTGLFYRSRRELRAAASRYFKDVRIYGPRQWYPGYSAIRHMKYMLKSLGDPQPTRALAQTVVTDVMLCDCRK